MSSTTAIATIVALLALVGVASMGAVAVVDRERLRTTADLAALSAAGAHLRGDAPACIVARDVVHRAGLQLGSCTIEGERVRMSVRAPARSHMFGLREVSVSAGPVVPQ